MCFKMSENVRRYVRKDEERRSSWWDVLRRSSLGRPVGLPKELGMCGATSCAEHIYVCMEPPSTTHAGDCMFIVPEVCGGNPCGMWCLIKRPQEFTDSA